MDKIKQFIAETLKLDWSRCYRCEKVRFFFGTMDWVKNGGICSHCQPGNRK